MINGPKKSSELNEATLGGSPLRLNSLMWLIRHNVIIALPVKTKFLLPMGQIQYIQSMSERNCTAKLV